MGRKDAELAQQAQQGAQQAQQLREGRREAAATDERMQQMKQAVAAEALAAAEVLDKAEQAAQLLGQQLLSMMQSRQGEESDGEEYEEVEVLRSAQVRLGWLGRFSMGVGWQGNESEGEEEEMAVLGSAQVRWGCGRASVQDKVWQKARCTILCCFLFLTSPLMLQQTCECLSQADADALPICVSDPSLVGPTALIWTNCSCYLCRASG